uniref:POU domain protein n=2 Tax=Photinus pyralis TaxID=7054 RepID=A0A1Y1MR41_PHOPY
MAEGGTEEESGDMLGPAIAPAHQPPALNMKPEDSDRESSISSPEPGSMMGMDGDTDYYRPQKLIQNCIDSSQKEHRISPPITSTAHLNGTMAGFSFQNYQNLASMQQTLPQAASLTSDMASASSPVANAPLNLSVNATATNCGKNSPLDNSLLCGTLPSQQNSSTLPSSLASQQPAPMPQFILASGQLVQGIQGAQLLIPTSQGLATQTILTIPVNHVNSSDQMVNLALSNGQVVTTSLANLQSMAQTNLLNQPNNSAATTNGNITPSLLNPTALSHLIANGSAQQFLQTLPQMLSSPHPTNQSALINPLTPNLLPTPSPILPTPPTQSSSQPVHRNHLINQINPNQYDSKVHQANIPRGSSSPTAGNCINRAPTSNGDLSIASHGSNSSQSLKRSPSSLSLSPSCNDNSTADLLVDSPNQPTINQTNSNVVDGINLDEIKEFAKAFKLRRLSLGLTQTQVGQALSVTEGPAYSQSAICSALASQMIAAAQLSSQQQAMFEKLDITPKSAQKIKPVLERWMKEAEERYKSGQNHLTDFIGVEPSKKRKRRTSFTPQALELLNAHFERNTHPSGTEITGLAHQLGYEREVIRIWFCNKRQALKNTVRMMSKENYYH